MTIRAARWGLAAAWGSLVLVVASAAMAAPGVLVVSFDGLRPVAIDEERMPVLSGLIENGSYQATCLNERPTATLPNHTSMVTGLGTARHGVLANVQLPGSVSHPTLFDVAKAAGLRVGFFVSKSKLGYLCKPESADVRVVGGDQDEMTDAVVAAIADRPLDLMFVHFADPDSTGHDEGWMTPAYLAAAAASDARLGRILAALDEAGVRQETTILVTADHGGQGTSHALNVPEVRYVPFVAEGASIAAGRSLCEQRHVTDIAPTAAALLGLTMPGVDGQVAEEAFAATPQPPCEPTAPVLGPPCALLPVLPILAGVAAVVLWRGGLGRRSSAEAPPD